MAFVSVPKDLSNVKTKLALNLTKRQLICFSAAGAIGIPVYFLSKGVIGNSAAILLMIALMFPFFFIGLYERDGQPAEKIILNMIRVRLLWPGKRLYITENLYKQLQEEGFFEEPKEKTKTAKKTAPKASASRRKQKRR